jgi:hypothetical protein
MNAIPMYTKIFSFSLSLFLNLSPSFLCVYFIDLIQVYIMSEEHNWKFAQCFGDKGDSDDITDGKFSTSFISHFKKGENGRKGERKGKEK